jgi:hypothetical protein
MPAGATLLSTLTLPGGSLSNGLLTLDDFTFTRNCSGPGVCAPLDASGIDVSLTLNTIHITGGFTALGIGSVTTADFVLAYDIASPLIGINAVQLLFNGAVVGNQSFAQVVETVVTPVNHLAGQGQVNVPGTLSDTFALDGSYTNLRITKDILLVAADSGGNLAAATISLVDQIYTGVDIGQQCAPGTCPETPEPASYGMMGIGLIGLYFAKRRL